MKKTIVTLTISLFISLFSIGQSGQTFPKYMGVGEKYQTPVMPDRAELHSGQ